MNATAVLLGVVVASGIGWFLGYRRGLIAERPLVEVPPPLDEGFHSHADHLDRCCWHFVDGTRCRSMPVAAAWGGMSSTCHSHSYKLSQGWPGIPPISG